MSRDVKVSGQLLIVLLVDDIIILHMEKGRTFMWSVVQAYQFTFMN